MTASRQLTALSMARGLERTARKRTREHVKMAKYYIKHKDWSAACRALCWAQQQEAFADGVARGLCVGR